MSFLTRVIMKWSQGEAKAMIRQTSGALPSSAAKLATISAADGFWWPYTRTSIVVSCSRNCGQRSDLCSGQSRLACVRHCLNKDIFPKPSAYCHRPE